MVGIVSSRCDGYRRCEKNRSDRECPHGSSLRTPSYSLIADVSPAILKSQLKRSLLATRAIEGRPSDLHNAFDPASTARAWLSLAVIDPEIVLEVSERAIGTPVITQRGSTGLDRIQKHRLDGFHQSFGALIRFAVTVGDCRGLTLGREPCAKQGFADIDIAEASHDALITKRRLQRRLFACAGFRQLGRIEFIAQRLRPESAQQRLLRKLGTRHGLH